MISANSSSYIFQFQNLKPLLVSRRYSAAEHVWIFWNLLNTETVSGEAPLESTSCSLFCFLAPVTCCHPTHILFPARNSFLILSWRGGLFVLLLLCSVQFSPSVVSDSLRPHEPQHARPPCPSTTPRVHTNPCPLSRWCNPTISSSVIPFSSWPQSFPASGSFPMTQLIAWGGQSIGVSASTSVLPLNTQDWSPLGWTGWISLQSKGLSRVFSNTTVQKRQSFCTQLSL